MDWSTLRNRFFNNWLKNNQSKLQLMLAALQNCHWCNDIGVHTSGLCESCWLRLPHSDNGCPQCALHVTVLQPDESMSKYIEPEYDDVNSVFLTTPRCGKCQSEPPYFDYCYAAFNYDTPINAWIRACKDKNNIWAAIKLERLFVQKMATPQSLPDLIVSIPSSRIRLLRRGFNLSALLSDKLSLHWGCQANHKLLRINLAASQRKLDREKRQTNSLNKFSLSDPNIASRFSHILLVDDVMTTGATLNAAAKLLKKAGVKTVGCAVFARVQ